MGRGASRTACDAERRTIVFSRARQLQNDRSSRSGVTPEGWMQPLEASWVNIQSRQNSQP
ncbi:hypothetical protein EIG75_18195 [Pseudomonas syringae]|nr:hypothetical protein [Pseudomonas syringae]RRD12536.1 hypothetical protein EIG75_18195 [Pseudomonas syringae]